MILHRKLLILSIVVFPCWVSADENKNEVRTPEFIIDVPKDHLFLVAIDRGTPAPDDDSKGGESKGVDPVLGQMMRLPAQVGVSLTYPEKRENSKSLVSWTVNAGYKYQEINALKGGGEVKTNWNGSVGYKFLMATRTQRVVYQQEGMIHHGFEKNIVETPINPSLKEVSTDIEGVKLYRIPFGEVDGVTRSIVIVVSDSFEKAKGLLSVSDRNPKFKWNTDWFHEQPGKD